MQGAQRACLCMQRKYDVGESLGTAIVQGDTGEEDRIPFGVKNRECIGFNILNCMHPSDSSNLLRTVAYRYAANVQTQETAKP